MEYQDIVKNGQETRVWWQTEKVNGVEKIHARVFDRHYQIRACVRERAKNSGMLKGEDFYTLAKCDNIDEAQNLLEVYSAYFDPDGISSFSKPYIRPKRQSHVAEYG